MAKKLHLSQEKTYIYPIWENDKFTISEKQLYGGKDSTTVPCGFITEMIFQKKFKRKRKMNNRLKAVASRIVPSLSNDNG